MGPCNLTRDENEASRWRTTGRRLAPCGNPPSPTPVEEGPLSRAQAASQRGWGLTRDGPALTGFASIDRHLGQALPASNAMRPEMTPRQHGRRAARSNRSVRWTKTNQQASALAWLELLARPQGPGRLAAALSPHRGGRGRTPMPFRDPGRIRDLGLIRWVQAKLGVDPKLELRTAPLDPEVTRSGRSATSMGEDDSVSGQVAGWARSKRCRGH